VPRRFNVASVKRENCWKNYLLRRNKCFVGTETLADDVIDVELMLIFGGPTGGSNVVLLQITWMLMTVLPLLFPYLAAAW
jgi:hypothetical protein